MFVSLWSILIGDRSLGRIIGLFFLLFHGNSAECIPIWLLQIRQPP